MKFTIITPTIWRSTAPRAIESVDAQTYPHWQHIVFVDCPLSQKKQVELLKYKSENRAFIFCDGEGYGNYGNTPRHMAWEHVAGTYILYLDDDNYYKDGSVLWKLYEELAEYQKNNNGQLPPWGVFPINRFKRKFFNHPAKYQTDISQVFHLRSHPAYGAIRFPNRNAIDADGDFVEELKAKDPGVMLNIDELVIYENTNHGQMI